MYKIFKDNEIDGVFTEYPDKADISYNEYDNSNSFVKLKPYIE